MFENKYHKLRYGIDKGGTRIFNIIKIVRY
jgi:hypothetical protein